jgi:hypothetical protein
MQASTLLRKLYEGEKLSEEDWIFIAGVGMTALLLVHDRCSDIKFSMPSESLPSSRDSKKRKKPKK